MGKIPIKGGVAFSGWRREVAAQLAGWYERSARVLPWRGTRDPYAILVSEMMLQQTGVATVIPYFRSWMDRWPSLSALAMATKDDVVAAWQGLGYYRRARNLLRIAVMLHDEGGRFPEDPETLLALPGVGPYTAAALASLAFDRPVAVSDGNVKRVIARLLACETPVNTGPGERIFRNLAQTLMGEADAATHNSAMMDLGATVCLPRRPRCRECPLAALCVGASSGVQQTLPRKKGRWVPVQAVFVALVLRSPKGVWVRRRSAEGLWASMWEMPWDQENTQAAFGSPREVVEWATSRWDRFELPPWIPGQPKTSEVRVVGPLQHAYTKYRLKVWGIDWQIPEYDVKEGSGGWLRPKEVGRWALPGPFVKILQVASDKSS